ncbi:hypothetical protein H5410_047538 [Solanum commersonii]|uniref:Uncharacterized protein n=1 Tax=Solanum commersonii TaxID=4109 RepID=A0A9J5XJE4_SOLCO|nr:hypothetical protein H5410_047538 [Solanum commersonii]
MIIVILMTGNVYTKQGTDTPTAASNSKFVKSSFSGIDLCKMLNIFASFCMAKQPCEASETALTVFFPWLLL